MHGLSGADGGQIAVFQKIVVRGDVVFKRRRVHIRKPVELDAGADAQTVAAGGLQPVDFGDICVPVHGNLRVGVLGKAQRRKAQLQRAANDFLRRAPAVSELRVRVCV